MKLRKAVSRQLLTGLLVLGFADSLSAQDQFEPGNRDPGSAPVTKLERTIVTARKLPEDLQHLPLSVTAVTRLQIEDGGIQSVGAAAASAPNVFMTDFTARKLSNPRFRGIGSSPNNPGVTTYIDGVPQLNANSSNIELLDIDQIEFVRGPQAALFGRNTMGGLINITSARPSKRSWIGGVSASHGNFDFREVRVTASGPLKTDQIGISLAGGYSARDGYTKNDLTGNDLDSRDAFFGKGQLLYAPTERWEARLIVAGERARDGDYAFGDLAAVRSNPHHVNRDFEGFTHRDILAPTLLVNYFGEKVDLAMITGGVWWKTLDATDLDYTPAPLITRRNEEKAFQFTEELRIASDSASPHVLADEFDLKWQGGVFFFTQNYDQDAFNDLNPPVAPVPLRDQSQAGLDDIGVGVYGQATLTAWDKLGFTAGLRGDFEHKEAHLRSFTIPALGPSTTENREDDFAEVSPQFSVEYRYAPKSMIYGAVGRGFKTGGFNAVAPSGNASYGAETSWNYEAGLKMSWLDDRLSAHAAAFYIDWDELQLNVPNLAVPGRFYIANAGSATSKGLELEIRARPMSDWELFGGVGYTDARFRSGSVSDGVNVGGNQLPFTPEFTANAGMQYSRELCRAVTVYARSEAVVHGNYDYDAQNTAGQDTFVLTNFRVGLRARHWFAEGWIRNALDEEYAPVAIPYTTAFAPSGFIAESGAPRTFGMTAGVRF